MKRLYDSRFVHFEFTEDLEGKEGFLADSIGVLKTNVETNAGAMDEVVAGNDRGLVDSDNVPWTFFYYDPLYDFKWAYRNGERVEYKNPGGKWERLHSWFWDYDTEYRIRGYASLKDLWEDSVEMWNWIRGQPYSATTQTLKESFWREVKGCEPPELLGPDICWLCALALQVRGAMHREYGIWDSKCKYCPLRSCREYDRLRSTTDREEREEICDKIIAAHMLYKPYLDCLDDVEMMRKVVEYAKYERPVE